MVVIDFEGCDPTHGQPSFLFEALTPALRALLMRGLARNGKRRPFSADPMADIGDNRDQYNDRNRKQHDVSI